MYGVPVLPDDGAVPGKELEGTSAPSGFLALGEVAAWLGSAPAGTSTDFGGRATLAVAAGDVKLVAPDSGANHLAVSPGRGGDVMQSSESVAHSGDDVDAEDDMMLMVGFFLCVW